MEAVDPRTLDPAHPRRVIVVGGGYAGLTFAVTLAHRTRDADGIEIVLIDPRPYQQALSELDLVAAGTPRPQFAELWYADVLRGLPIKVVHDRLENVCTDDQCVETGPRGGPVVRIPYWRLVLATGAIPHIPDVPGLRGAALTMWSVDDALTLQRAIEEQFRRAVTICDPAERACALAVTVVGGGATGVEIVGTIAKRMPRMISRAGHDPGELTVTLIEGRPDILYDLPDTQRARARKRLEKMGVHVLLGRNLERVEDGIAYLEGGTGVPSPVLVWCGGAHADPDAVGWGLVFDNSGRLVCDENLKAQGHPAIYVIGDVAAFRDPSSGRVLPMLAQFAIREAEHAADAVLREAHDEPARPFVPSMHGEFVSVGPGWGVGWMFHVNISGWPAIVMKRLTYIMYWVQVGSFRLAWKRTVQMLRMRH
jgi:NADH:ubiquinone reductase (H+-translocating)